MSDIDIVNSYILFQLYHAEHPDDQALKHPQKFAVAKYLEKLVRQLAGMNENRQPPGFNNQKENMGSLLCNNTDRTES